MRTRVMLEYTGLTLEDVQAEGFRERIFHPKDLERCGKSARRLSRSESRLKSNCGCGETTDSIAGS